MNTEDIYILCYNWNFSFGLVVPNTPSWNIRNYWRVSSIKQTNKNKNKNIPDLLSLIVSINRFFLFLFLFLYFCNFCIFFLNIICLSFFVFFFVLFEFFIYLFSCRGGYFNGIELSAMVSILRVIASYLPYITFI